MFFVFNKMLVIRVRIQKMLVRIANREYPDQTASSGYPAAIWCQNNAISTSMGHLDIAFGLKRHCFKVVCLLGMCCLSRPFWLAT